MKTTHRRLLLLAAALLAGAWALQVGVVAGAGDDSRPKGPAEGGAMSVMMQMDRIDIERLRQAYNGR